LVTIYIKIYDVRVPRLIEKNVYSEDLLDYITPENLREAQSNMVNETAYKTEYKGIQGVYGEDVYGAQGLDSTLGGWSPVEDNME